MKIEDIRALKVEELYSELDRLRRHSFDLRSLTVTEKVEDPTQVGKTRRDIARVLTVLREKGEKNVEQRAAHLLAQAAARR